MSQPTVTTADDLLLLLRQFQYLSIQQITKLLGKETSINNMRSKLKKLVESGLVGYNHIKWWRPGELSVIFMVFHP